MRTIVFLAEAAREYDQLDSVIRQRVEADLIHLAHDPLLLAGQIKKLKGDPALRLRIGDWRVIFDHQPQRVIILAIGHRSRIYR